MRKSDTAFTPWFKDYLIAMLLMLVSLALSRLLLAKGYQLSAMVASVTFICFGVDSFFNGWRRERGVIVEQAAIKSLLLATDGDAYKVQQDIKIACGLVSYGNIDLVIEPPWSNLSFVVEIKSNAGIVKKLFGLSILGKSHFLSKPQKQVNSQCKYLGNRWHFPVLWMPKSTLNTSFTHKGILIVNGEASLLLTALQEFDLTREAPAKVKFPYPPPADMIDTLKRSGFAYNGVEYCWNGRLTKKWLSAAISRFASAHADVILMKR